MLKNVRHSMGEQIFVMEGGDTGVGYWYPTDEAKTWWMEKQDQRTNEKIYVTKQSKWKMPTS